MLVRGEAHGQRVDRVLGPRHSQRGIGCHLHWSKEGRDKDDRRRSNSGVWKNHFSNWRSAMSIPRDSVCLGCGLGFCILTNTSNESASSDPVPPLKKHLYRRGRSHPRRLGTRGGFQCFSSEFCWQWRWKPGPGHTSKAAVGSIANWTCLGSSLVAKYWVHVDKTYS